MRGIVSDAIIWARHCERGTVSETMSGRHGKRDTTSFARHSHTYCLQLDQCHPAEFCSHYRRKRPQLWLIRCLSFVSWKCSCVVRCTGRIYSIHLRQFDACWDQNVTNVARLAVPIRQGIALSSVTFIRCVISFESIVKSDPNRTINLLIWRLFINVFVFNVFWGIESYIFILTFPVISH